MLMQKLRWHVWSCFKKQSNSYTVQYKAKNYCLKTAVYRTIDSTWLLLHFCQLAQTRVLHKSNNSVAYFINTVLYITAHMHKYMYKFILENGCCSLAKKTIMTWHKNTLRGTQCNKLKTDICESWVNNSGHCSSMWLNVHVAARLNNVSHNVQHTSHVKLHCSLPLQEL